MNWNKLIIKILRFSEFVGMVQTVVKVRSRVFWFRIKLLKLAEQIKKKVKETFNVSLTVEPVIFN
jgi:hypothetical protein